MMEYKLKKGLGRMAVTMATFALVGVTAAVARAAEKGPVVVVPNPAAAKASPAAPDKKVDISDLENKYWAPKDTDFSVVQNRTYAKENRYFLSAEYGRPINDQWSNGSAYSVVANYFWSERFGVQATYLKANMTNNSATTALTGFGSGIQPDHNRLDSYYGVGFNVVPFYAKMSFWGKRIIYFDMAITPTLGMTTYDQVLSTGNHAKSGFTYGLDITQYFFFSNHFAIRADLKNQWHSEDVASFVGNTGQGTVTGGKVKSDVAQDTLFLFGATVFY